MTDIPQDPARAQNRPGGAAFIGRSQEMASLSAVLEDSLAGNGGVVMLVGDPGIGKTRTVNEITGLAVERGARVLWGSC